MTRPLTEPVGDFGEEIASIKRRLSLGAGTMGRLKSIAITALVGVIAGGAGVVFMAGRLDRTVEVQGQQIDRLERRMDEQAAEVVKLQETVRTRLDKHDADARERYDALERKLDQALAPKRRRR